MTKRKKPRLDDYGSAPKRRAKPEKRLWLCWDSEYPEEGAEVWEAATFEEAQRIHRRRMHDRKMEVAGEPLTLEVLNARIKIEVEEEVGNAKRLAEESAATRLASMRNQVESTARELSNMTMLRDAWRGSDRLVREALGLPPGPALAPPDIPTCDGAKSTRDRQLIAEKRARELETALLDLWEWQRNVQEVVPDELCERIQALVPGVVTGHEPTRGRP